MNTDVLCGAASVLLPRFEPRTALALMLERGITIFCGVPTMHWALLNCDRGDLDLEAVARTLRIAASGGAALPLEVLRGFERRFEVPILEGYGLSETSPVASFNHRDRPRKPGSVGTPVWGVEMKIVDAEDREVPVGEPGEFEEAMMEDPDISLRSPVGNLTGPAT